MGKQWVKKAARREALGTKSWGVRIDMDSVQRYRVTIKRVRNTVSLKKKGEYDVRQVDVHIIRTAMYGMKKETLQQN